jgi:ubiquitin-protein ligase
MNEQTIDLNLFNNDPIKLLKSINNDNYYTLHLEYSSYPIKLITDFDNYCFASSAIENIGLDKFNLAISFKYRSIINIIKQLNETILVKEIKKELNDPFHIYQKIDKYDKSNINYSELFKLYSDNVDKKFKNTNELLLSPTQIIQLFINEIKKINSNNEYKHYITIDPSNMFSLIINLEFEQKIELRLIIDPYFYPVAPPKIEYIKPKIKLELLFSINNLDILMLKNWSSMINLEYLIINLANQLEPIIKDYIISEKSEDTELESEIIKLSTLIKNDFDNKIKFNIPIPKQTKLSSVNYWKSGTGYGTSKDVFEQWNINKYIEDKEKEKYNILICIGKINNLIDKPIISIKNGNILESYINHQISGLTILELHKNKQFYYEIFNLINNIITFGIPQNIINNICDNIKIVYEEINQIIQIDESMASNELFKIICYTFELLITNYKIVPEKHFLISNDLKEEYCKIMKPLQFSNYEIPSYHNYIKNDTKLHQSALMRTLSEISSFKSGLPLNWESSIWVRVSKTRFNLFSFIISGPKDTPYENGLFEFHGYFPHDFPNSIPEVIIHTTNNGKVRFNPNLYANGKVCLSLLGTWQGLDSEKWNPKTSTFLQVMISIQSLILVEQPYFNEPGWEKEMGSPKGIINSDNYNKSIHTNTIMLGMINMIKNPPSGFEQVVLTHFSMKKEEIIATTLKWEQTATTHKELITAYRKELVELLI